MAATEIFGKLPNITKIHSEAAVKLAAGESALQAALTPGQKAARTKKARAAKPQARMAR